MEQLPRRPVFDNRKSSVRCRPVLNSPASDFQSIKQQLSNENGSISMIERWLMNLYLAVVRDVGVTLPVVYHKA